MIYWDKGEIIDIIEENDDIQILMIKTDKSVKKAIHYKSFLPSLSIGEKVHLNKTATELNLGTGGFDFVVTPFCNIKGLNTTIKNNGHIMKLRYTPLQFSVQACEEQDSPYHNIFTEARSLMDLPVIIGELHSMLPILVTVIRQDERERNLRRKKIAYIMTDGASLPIKFSKHVRKLKELGWLDYTITVNHAFGGDLEAVNIYTGLIAAKYILNADVVIVLMGPGIVGTGTLLGHTGVEQGTISNAVASLEGRPISIIRASLKDRRERQTGISHHTISNLRYISLVSTIIPYPESIERNYKQIYQDLLKNFTDKHVLQSIPINHDKIKEHLDHYPFNITSMGRTINDDPIFFDFVASAGLLINNMVD